MTERNFKLDGTMYILPVSNPDLSVKDMYDMVSEAVKAEIIEIESMSLDYLDIVTYGHQVEDRKPTGVSIGFTAYGKYND